MKSPERAISGRTSRNRDAVQGEGLKVLVKGAVLKEEFTIGEVGLDRLTFDQLAQDKALILIGVAVVEDSKGKKTKIRSGKVLIDLE